MSVTLLIVWHHTIYYLNKILTGGGTHILLDAQIVQYVSQSVNDNPSQDPTNSVA